MSWKNGFPKDNVYFQTDRGILYCGDCLEIMKKFPKESIDLVLTDPPYGIGVDKMGYTKGCLLYTSPSPRDRQKSRMPSSA